MPQHLSVHYLPMLLAHYDNVNVGVPSQINKTDTENSLARSWQKLIEPFVEENDQQYAIEWVQYACKQLFKSLPERINQIELRLIEGPVMCGIRLHGKKDPKLELALNAQVLKRKVDARGDLTDAARKVMLRFAMLHEVIHFSHPEYTEREVLGAQRNWISGLSEEEQALLRSAIALLELPTQGTRNLLSFIESATVSPTSELQVEAALDLLEKHADPQIRFFSQKLWDNKLTYGPVMWASLRNTFLRCVPITSAGDFVGKFIWTWPVAIIEALLIIVFGSVRFFTLTKNFSNSKTTLFTHLRETGDKQLSRVIKVVNFIAYAFLLFITLLVTLPDYSLNVLPTGIVKTVAKNDLLKLESKGLTALIDKATDEKKDQVGIEEADAIVEVIGHKAQNQLLIISPLRNKLSSPSAITRRHAFELLTILYKSQSLYTRTYSALDGVMLDQVASETNSDLKQSIEKFLIGRLPKDSTNNWTDIKSIIKSLEGIDVGLWKDEIEVLLTDSGSFVANDRSFQVVRPALKSLALELQSRASIEALSTSMILHSKILAKSPALDNQAIESLESYASNSAIANEVRKRLSEEFSPSADLDTTSTAVQRKKLVAITRILANIQSDSLQVLENWLKSADSNSEPLSRAKYEAIVLEEAGKYLDRENAKDEQYGLDLVSRMVLLKGFQSGDETLNLLQKQTSTAAENLLQQFQLWFETGDRHIIKDYSASVALHANHQWAMNYGYLKGLIRNLGTDSVANDFFYDNYHRIGLPDNQKADLLIANHKALVADSSGMDHISRALTNNLNEMITIQYSQGLSAQLKDSLNTYLESAYMPVVFEVYSHQLLNARKGEAAYTEDLLNHYLSNYSSEKRGSYNTEVATRLLNNVIFSDTPPGAIRLINTYGVFLNSDKATHDQRFNFWQDLISITQSADDENIKITCFNQLDHLLDYPVLDLKNIYGDDAQSPTRSLQKRLYASIFDALAKDDFTIQSHLIKMLINRLDVNTYTLDNYANSLGEVNIHFEDPKTKTRYYQLLFYKLGEWLQSNDVLKQTVVIEALAEVDFDPWELYARDEVKTLILQAFEALGDVKEHLPRELIINRFLDRFIIPDQHLFEGREYSKLIKNLSDSDQDLSHWVELIPYWLLNRTPEIQKAGHTFIRLLLQKQNTAVFEDVLLSLLAQYADYRQLLNRMEFPYPEKQWRAKLNYYQFNQPLSAIDSSRINQDEWPYLKDIKKLARVHRDSNYVSSEIIEGIDLDLYKEGIERYEKHGHYRELPNQGLRAIATLASTGTYFTKELLVQLLERPQMHYDFTFQFLTLNGLINSSFDPDEKASLLEKAFHTGDGNKDEESNKWNLMAFKKLLQRASFNKLDTTSQRYFYFKQGDQTGKWLRANIVLEIQRYISMRDISLLKFMPRLVQYYSGDQLISYLLEESFLQQVGCPVDGVSESFAEVAGYNMAFNLELLRSLDDRYLYKHMAYPVLSKSMNCDYLWNDIKNDNSLLKVVDGGQLNSELNNYLMQSYRYQYNLLDADSEIEQRLRNRIDLIAKLDLLTSYKNTSPSLSNDVFADSTNQEIGRNNKNIWWLMHGSYAKQLWLHKVHDQLQSNSELNTQESANRDAFHKRQELLEQLKNVYLADSKLDLLFDLYQTSYKNHDLGNLELFKQYLDEHVGNSLPDPYKKVFSQTIFVNYQNELTFSWDIVFDLLNSEKSQFRFLGWLVLTNVIRFRDLQPPAPDKRGPLIDLIESRLEGLPSFLADKLVYWGTPTSWGLSQAQKDQFRRIDDYARALAWPERYGTSQ